MDPVKLLAVTIPEIQLAIEDELEQLVPFASTDWLYWDGTNEALKYLTDDEIEHAKLNNDRLFEMSSKVPTVADVVDLNSKEFRAEWRFFVCPTCDYPCPVMMAYANGRISGVEWMGRSCVRYSRIT